YQADTATYSAWVTLTIREEDWTLIGLSFHSTGATFSGVISVTAWIQSQIIDLSIRSVASVRLCQEAFQFSAEEETGQLIERFNKWLDDVLIAGLDYWRKQL